MGSQSKFTDKIKLLVIERVNVLSWVVRLYCES